MTAATTTFEDSFNALLTAFLRERIGREDIVLNWYEQETEEHFSNCDTCAYEETVVRFSYALPELPSNGYTYQGDFGALIRDLSELDARLKASAEA